LEYGVWSAEMKTTMKVRYLLLVLMMIVPVVTLAQTSADDEMEDPRATSARWARQLGHYDPLVRQEAAEALARLAAVDQKKLVEGYRLQEKNKNVRLALDWALYRMGKSDSLFQIVRELNSGRHNQAVSYLAKVESPSLLHSYLKDEDRPPKITVGLLEALAELGDQESLAVITPFRDSYAPGVAAAAENAVEKIEARLAQTEPAKPIRPRTVSTTEKTSP
jgi:HEAT repeat protein